MDNENSIDFLSLVVRALGLVLLVIGLYIGIKVIFEAWNLYQEPQRIERLSKAIEKGSNLDAVLANAATKVIPSKNNNQQPEAKTAKANKKPTLRLSYFLAWGVAVAMLLVIGSLAATLMRTGGQLVLYDLQAKKLANQILRQSLLPKE